MVALLSQSGVGEFGHLLREMNSRGGFPISVLTDDSGLAIASAAASGQDLLLAVLVPAKEKYYRHLTNQATQAMQRLWSD